MAHHQGKNHGRKDTTTKTGADGSAKRNIIRRGGNGGGPQRKERAASRDFDDGSMDYEAAYLDENDPNFDPYPPIFHLCVESAFDDQTGKENGSYFSPTYNEDKFIHATEDPAALLDVANHFYKGEAGAWVCLKIDPIKLGCDVIYEKPAPVGDKAAYDSDNNMEFPHIYGGIPAGAIMQRMAVNRGEDGTFLGIEGI